MRIKFITSSIILLLAITASAQVQQGKVRTKGRMSHGKHIRGIPLSNVIVQIKGRNSVISDANGTFSFKVPKKQYTVENVKKAGYRLFDFDILNKQYSFSENPVEIVLEDLNQLEIDRRSFERQVTKALYDDIERQSKKIEELKEQNKISEEKYIELVRKLNSDEENNERIIKDMVEYYSSIDFDLLNNFQIQIYDLIMSGRLNEADSMLRSKGDYHERIRELHKVRDAIAQAKSNLEKSEKAEEQKSKELADDLYSHFLIFKTTHQNDSAEHYLKMRIEEIDPNNAKWIADLGDFIMEYQPDTTKAMEYQKKALNIAISSNDHNLVSSILNSIGIIYDYMDDYDQAIRYFSQALDLKEKYGLTKSTVYHNIGRIYAHMDMVEESLNYFDKAKKNYKEENDSDGLASVLVSIGKLYTKRGLLNEAIDCYSNSAQIWQSNNNFHLYEAYNALASTYFELDSIKLAFEYGEKSLSILRSEFGENHPNTASQLSQLGLFYEGIGRYEEARNYKLRALNIQRSLFGENNSEIGASYNNLALTCIGMRNYDEAFEYINKSLQINLLLYGENSSAVATNYSILSDLLNRSKSNDEALEYSQKALEIFRNLYGENNQMVANQYNAIAGILEDLGKLDESESYYEKALVLFRNIYGDSNNNVARIYNNLGSLHTEKGDYDNSLKHMNKALDIYRNVYGENSIYVAIGYENISRIYYKKHDYKEAIAHIKEAIDIKTSLYGDDSPQLDDSYYVCGMYYELNDDIENAIEYYNKSFSIKQRYNIVDRGMLPNILYYLYRQIIDKNSINHLDDFKIFSKDKTFIVSFEDESTASKLDLHGDYYILRYNNWDILDIISFTNEHKSLGEGPRDVLLMSISDETISTHHFDGKMGVPAIYKVVGQEKKQEILRKYQEWKDANH